MKRREGWRPAGRLHVDPAKEIEEELRLHLEGRVAEYVAQGMSEDEARRMARTRFGDVRRVADEIRAAQGRHPTEATKRGVGMTSETVFQDVRLSLRTLARRPAFAAAALVTLALAVGATTAAFSVVNGVLLRPLPHPDPHELVLIWEVDERGPEPEPRNPVTPATFDDWRRRGGSFESMAGFGVFPMTLRTETGPEQVMGAVVTADFFEVLEASTVLGRTFLPDEDRPGKDEGVVVISHEYWQSRFGGDPDVLGRALGPFSSRQVIGVLAPGFEFIDERPVIFVPYRLDEETLANRRSHFMRVVGRLAQGITTAAAQEEMDGLSAALTEEHPESLTGFGVNVEPLVAFVVGPVRQALVVLFAAVGFVLLIACVNVANLTLSKGLAERRIDAVRAAVGASRARLLQHRLTEALVLAFLGGGLGVGLAWVATRVLVAAGPDSLPRLHEIGLDGGVLAFGMLIAALAGVMSGVVPAFQAARSGPARELREGSRSVTGGLDHKIRTGFAIVQVTLSLVLLVSAGLMIQTFARLTRVDPGFVPGGVLTSTVSMTDPADSTRALQALKLDRVLAEMRNLPGVRDAGLTKFLPFDQDEWTWSVTIEGEPAPPEGEKLDYGMHAVSDGYFRTMGIPVLEGRAIEATDRDEAPRVAVVNEAFVRRFFDPGEDAVGRRFALAAVPDEMMEIVGVVGDTHHYTLDQSPRPAFFLPYDQIPYDWFIGDMSVAVRTAGDPADLAPALRQTLRSVGPDLLIGPMLPMETRIRASVERRRFALVLLVTFACAALAIAVVGIYGLMAFAVSQRRQEIGVRIALGAEPSRLIGRFLATGLRPVMAGVALGLVGAAGFAKLQESLLYGVEPVDPLTYGSVAAVLIGAATLATWWPARRAARVDPVEVLKSE